mgnify:CR=1 FL=1
MALEFQLHRPEPSTAEVDCVVVGVYADASLSPAAPSLMTSIQAPSFPWSPGIRTFRIMTSLILRLVGGRSVDPEPGASCSAAGRAGPSRDDEHPQREPSSTRAENIRIMSRV